MAAIRFATKPAVIGMIHVGALPGTAQASKSLSSIIADAVAEAVLYEDSGVDGVILENMHDRPYQNGDSTVGPEIIASMTRVATEVRTILSCPCGVQVLAGANRGALAVALAADLQFIRAEGFVFGHLADEGWMDACAGPLLRERARLGPEAQTIQIWTDIKKKHSAHAATADVSLAETAQAAAYNLSDALIISGAHTGSATAPEDLVSVKEATELPVYIGSGLTAENVSAYRLADGFIVGSSIKEEGYWENPLCKERLNAFVDAARGL